MSRWNVYNRLSMFFLSFSLFFFFHSFCCFGFSFCLAAESLQGAASLWAYVWSALVRSAGGFREWEEYGFLFTQFGARLFLLLQLLGLLWVSAEEQPAIDSSSTWGTGCGVSQNRCIICKILLHFTNLQLSHVSQESGNGLSLADHHLFGAKLFGCLQQQGMSWPMRSTLQIAFVYLNISRV